MPALAFIQLLISVPLMQGICCIILLKRYGFIRAIALEIKLLLVWLLEL
ncbi:MAG: hypothetical protein F6K17_21535 [Okeania sp. SIO3C4]|nr:hypothetical protein [Okeania sp. SIO3C4]